MGLPDILLDSDVIIAWLRGLEPFRSVIPGMLEEGKNLSWTVVSVAEIFAGARPKEKRDIANLFLVLELLPLTQEIGKKGGRYLAAYARSHGVELGDAMIAAAASVNKIPLWTLNKKHYPMKDIRFFRTG
jgi:predicted nucleic acid-binding protein